jgi:TonB family protein
MAEMSLKMRGFSKSEVLFFPGNIPARAGVKLSMDPDRLRSFVDVQAPKLFAILILICLWLNAPVLVAFAQSSASETPGSKSHRGNFDYHSMGLFIRKTQPFYPPAAIAAGISGTVVLNATILGTGILADVRVLSGPQMLQQGSLEAVRTWLCRPYLLDGVPPVRKIKINVIFTLEEDGKATIKTTESEPEIVKIPSPADVGNPPESK